MSTTPVAIPPNKTKYVRAVVWTGLSNNPVTGLLVVRERAKAGTKVEESRYAVLELPPTWGRRFRLTKPDRAVYHCLLAFAGPEHDRCECRGFEAGFRCKHLEAVKALVENSLVPVPSVPGGYLLNEYQTEE